MALVQGPLFSMEATGTYGGAVTFAKWRGRPYARIRVDPANPMTAAQQASRNRVRATGAAQHFANISTQKGSGRSITDKAAITAQTPSGFAWNGYLSDLMIGSGGTTYAAAEAAYAALSAAQKTAWDNAAGALVPPIPDVAQVAAGGAPAPSLAKGNVFFLYQYGLATAGIAPVPGAVPPAYA